MQYPMDDNSIMPFGKYQGKKLVNVPSAYLKWLWEKKLCVGPLKEYIKDNLEVIEQQIKRGE
jgi:uncharacterized protein (DUF3820 family)